MGLLQQSLANLEAVRDPANGYWPFASPAPCSIERRLKENVDKAIGCLRSAIADHESLFHGHNGTDIPTTVIGRVR